jgi:hypothetical protein
MISACEAPLQQVGDCNIAPERINLRRRVVGMPFDGMISQTQNSQGKRLG